VKNCHIFNNEPVITILKKLICVSEISFLILTKNTLESFFTVKGAIFLLPYIRICPEDKEYCVLPLKPLKVKKIFIAVFLYIRVLTRLVKKNVIIFCFKELRSFLTAKKELYKTDKE